MDDTRPGTARTRHSVHYTFTSLHFTSLLKSLKDRATLHYTAHYCINTKRTRVFATQMRQVLSKSRSVRSTAKCALASDLSPCWAWCHGEARPNDAADSDKTQVVAAGLPRAAHHIRYTLGHQEPHVPTPRLASARTGANSPHCAGLGAGEGAPAASAGDSYGIWRADRLTPPHDGLNRLRRRPLALWCPGGLSWPHANLCAIAPRIQHSGRMRHAATLIQTDVHDGGAQHPRAALGAAGALDQACRYPRSSVLSPCRVILCKRDDSHMAR